MVVGPGVRSFFEEVLAAPSTIRPDALSQSNVATVVEEVAADMLITEIDTGGGALRLRRGPLQRRLEIYPGRGWA